MSWLNLNQSLSGLKGQFKNLANEVFSEGIVEDTDPFTEVTAANEKIKELQSLCASQDAEIKTLRRQNATLHQDKLNAISKDNGSGSKSSKEPPAENEEETSWFWDPPDAETSTPSKSAKTDENQRLSALVTSLQAEISNLKTKTEETKKSDNNEGLKPIRNDAAKVKELREQLELLKNENVTLTTNLEDLDSQHQMAIDEVIKLKKELQVNYEILQKKHENLEKDNEEYKTRLKNIESEEEASFKDLSETNLKLISDLDTMHHKFDNLERVHRVLIENTERFQEENQELSEENFKLQEDCAKMQHDLEQLQNKNHPPVKGNENHVPNEKYRELEDKNLDLERKLAELVPKKAKGDGLDTIHDSNAQEVIAKLKFEIVELQNKLNTNEEIKRLNLEIDHLRKEVDGLSTQQSENFISCVSIREVIDKYMAPDFPAIQKYLKNSSTELLEYTDMCLKNYADLRSKNETLESRASEDSRIINNLQANIDEMNAEIDILNGDLSHYSHEASEQKKNNDFLIAEIGALKSLSKLEPILEHNNEEHMEKLQTELDDCSNLNKNIEAELEKYENQLLEAEAEKNKVMGELNSCKEELKQAMDEIGLLKKAQNNSVDDESLSILQKKLTDTQNELDKIKTQLHTVSVENEKNKIDLTIVDNDKVLLLREISELKANIQTKSIIEDYAKKIEAEKTDLEIKLCHLSEMETMVETLNKKNDYLKEKIARLDATVESAAMNLTQEVIIHKNKEMKTNKIHKEKEQELLKAQAKIVALETTPNIAVLLDTKKELEESSLKLADFMGPDYSIRPSVSEAKKVPPGIPPEILLENGLKDAAKSLISNVERLKQNVLTDRNSSVESLKADLGKTNAELEDLKIAHEDLKPVLIDKKLLEAKVKQLAMEVIEREKDIDSMEAQYDKLFKDFTRVQKELDGMDEKVKELKDVVSEKDKEIVTKVVEIEMLKEEIKDIDAEFTKVKEQKHKLCLEKDILRNEKLEFAKTNEKITENEQTITTLNQKILRLETEMEYIRIQNIGKLAEARSKAAENPQAKEEYLRLKADYDSIEKQKLEADVQIQTLSSALLELETKMKSLATEEDVRLDEWKQLESHKAEAQVQIQQLITEKNELINLVTQKHQESITYHAEIQRLNAVLFTESEKYKELERLTEDLKVAAQNTSKIYQEANSQDIEQLTTTLREKTDRCLQLEGILDEIRMAGFTPEELEKLREKNQFLVEKCEIMGNNLVMEQANSRQIIQEKIQIIEKEQSMSRELERLRQHLLEMEEEHTKELVAAEQRWQEAQAKLTSAEEKVKHSSTMYTSNSIRANQEVETLRTQIKLVERQRDEIQSHLSQSEDRNSKNLAALTNLQCVLEQFQMDKERDGEAVAGRARRDLNSAREEIQRLQRQIVDVEDKLRDSNSGLRAAARLSGQLEARAAQVQEAKEIAAKLEGELSQWKKKYKDAVSNQQDKVDKSLVKNLLMGYINTVNQRQGDRIQVLRLLSTVLDFDQTECERAGLGRATLPGSANHGGADSLAQEFIKFLEKESRPQLKVGLPNLLHLGQAQGPNSPNLSTKSDSPSSISSQQMRSSNSPFQMQSTQSQQSTTKPVVPIVVPVTIDNPIITNANSNSPVTVVSSAGNVDTGVSTAAGNTMFSSSLGGFSLFTPIANPDLVINQTRNSEGAILKNVLKDT